MMREHQRKRTHAGTNCTIDNCPVSPENSGAVREKKNRNSRERVVKYFALTTEAPRKFSSFVTNKVYLFSLSASRNFRRI